MSPSPNAPDASAASLRKGIAFLVASAFGFALMGMFVRLADCCGDAIPAIQKSFFRNLVALVLAAAMFARRRRTGGTHASAGGWIPFLPSPGASRAKPLLILLARATFGTIGIFGNFYALSHMPVADALMLNKLSPFFAVLFSWLFLRERISKRQMLCLAGALAGAALVVKPGFGESSIFPAACGLIGGIGAGIAYTCLRELGLMKMDGAFIVLFFSTFSTLASLPFMALDYHPMNPMQLLVLCGAGAAAALGQFTVTAAYRFAPARRIAVWDYSNIIFGAILGFLAFGQVPDAWSVLGFIVILAMALSLNPHHASSPNDNCKTLNIGIISRFHRHES